MTVSSGAFFGIRGRFIGSGLALAIALGFAAVTVRTSGDALVAAGHRLLGTPDSQTVHGIAYAVVAALMVTVALYTATRPSSPCRRTSCPSSLRSWCSASSPSRAASTPGRRVGTMRSAVSGRPGRCLPCCSLPHPSPTGRRSATTPGAYRRFGSATSRSVSHSAAGCSSSVMLPPACSAPSCARATPAHLPVIVAVHDRLHDKANEMTPLRRAQRIAGPVAQLTDIMHRYPTIAVDDARAHSAEQRDLCRDAT